MSGFERSKFLTAAVKYTAAKNLDPPSSSTETLTTDTEMLNQENAPTRPKRTYRRRGQRRKVTVAVTRHTATEPETESKPTRGRGRGSRGRASRSKTSKRSAKEVPKELAAEEEEPKDVASKEGEQKDLAANEEEPNEIEVVKVVEKEIPQDPPTCEADHAILEMANELLRQESTRRPKMVLVELEHANSQAGAEAALPKSQDPASQNPPSFQFPVCRDATVSYPFRSSFGSYQGNVNVGSVSSSLPKSTLPGHSKIVFSQGNNVISTMIPLDELVSLASNRIAASSAVAAKKAELEAGFAKASPGQSQGSSGPAGPKKVQDMWRACRLIVEKYTEKSRQLQIVLERYKALEIRYNYMTTGRAAECSHIRCNACKKIVEDNHAYKVWIDKLNSEINSKNELISQREKEIEELKNERQEFFGNWEMENINIPSPEPPLFTEETFQDFLSDLYTGK